MRILAHGLRRIGVSIRANAASQATGLLPWWARHLPVTHFIVVGDSMTPTLASGRHLLASPLPYYISSPARGDIVLLRDPWKDGCHYVKRVIGLPGEDVRITGGMVLIDGRELQEPYLALATAPRAGERSAWMLGDGEYVLLGDNRRDSRDSRAAGVVQRRAIAGRMLLSWRPRAGPRPLSQ